jgi:hypothetical protein
MSSKQDQRLEPVTRNQGKYTGRMRLEFGLN